MTFSGLGDDQFTVALLLRRYLELEEACLQYKTKHQLLNKIDPTTLRKHKGELNAVEAFLKGT